MGEGVSAGRYLNATRLPDCRYVLSPLSIRDGTGAHGTDTWIQRPLIRLRRHVSPVDSLQADNSPSEPPGCAAHSTILHPRPSTNSTRTLHHPTHAPPPQQKPDPPTRHSIGPKRAARPSSRAIHPPIHRRNIPKDQERTTWSAAPTITCPTQLRPCPSYPLLMLSHLEHLGLLPCSFRRSIRPLRPSCALVFLSSCLQSSQLFSFCRLFTHMTLEGKTKKKKVQLNSVLGNDTHNATKTQSCTQ